MSADSNLEEINIDLDLIEIMPKFVSNTKSDIERLKKALSTDDYHEIFEIGHAIKGYGAAYGFPQISSLALEIENESKEQAKQRINSKVELLDKILLKIEEALAQAIKT